MSTILSPGTLINDRYEVEDFVGAGGMQEVYRANDRTFQRIVALKIPKNVSAQKRFQRSAVLSARVNHPNVAKTLDFFEISGSEHLIEEFIPGQDLSIFAGQFVRIDPFLAAHLFHHIVKGIAASHHVGVFHRDLKPSNIMVSSEMWPEVIKVTDFGIAKMAEGEFEKEVPEFLQNSITTSQTLVGALPYMAPELIAQPTTAHLSADIWSSAAILYELLTGNKPFGSGLAAVTKITSGKLPAIPTVDGNAFQFKPFMDQLWELIKQCLKQKPGERPTADDLVSSCGNLCYSIQQRAIGVIDRYGRDAGTYGFVNVTNPNTRVFFHRDSFYGPAPQEGMRVALAWHEGGGASRAHPVVPLK